jgi:L-lactate dehydrogenase
MERQGRPEVVARTGAVETWDARRLPGLWTTALAVERAAALARAHGLGAVAIRRSHHIGCLAAFLEKPARQGFVVLVLSSDPSAASVAPFGGTRPLFTPDPIAAGIPTGSQPILIDISTSITTNGLSARARAEGRPLPGRWLLTSGGEPTDDPNVLLHGGSILPVGGLDHGHKGFALCLLVEALTQGLAGFGRAEAPADWGAGVFVLAIAPGAFGPAADFVRETDWLASACRASPPRPGSQGVRLPGEAALSRKARALREGVELYPGLAEGLAALGKELKVAFPPPVGGR